MSNLSTTDDAFETDKKRRKRRQQNNRDNIGTPSFVHLLKFFDASPSRARPYSVLLAQYVSVTSWKMDVTGAHIG